MGIVELDFDLNNYLKRNTLSKEEFEKQQKRLQKEGVDFEEGNVESDTKAAEYAPGADASMRGQE